MTLRVRHKQPHGDEATEPEPSTVGEVGSLVHRFGWGEVVDQVVVEVAEREVPDGEQDDDDRGDDEPSVSHGQFSLLYRLETDRNLMNRLIA